RPASVIDSVALPASPNPEADVDFGVATSGDYESFFLYNGERYEHIIDPRSCQPLREGVAGVTVIYPGSCMAADALATTLCVLGPEDGRRFFQDQALGLFSAGVRAVMLIPQPDAGGAFRRLDFEVNQTGEVRVTESMVE
ncbi:MAG: FAD:protein FMN transferase, partial [Planctomycetes bacterium]|nr:FAD:protein FMN transferase [Planctomycetota bacterium]